MYTGTLINDLLAAVERAEQRAAVVKVCRQASAVAVELQMLEAMYGQPLRGEAAMAGAA